MYVGSTQDGDTVRRHREHLKEKKSIGPWLRSFALAPEPKEITRLIFDDVSMLFWWEDHFIETLETNVAFGGLNQTRAQGPDHAAIGKLGGQSPVAGMSRIEHLRRIGKIGGSRTDGSGPRKWAKLHPEQASENGRIAHKLHPGLASARMKKTHQLHPEIAKALGHKYGPKNSLILNHNRWHVARGRLSPSCKLCKEEVRRYDQP